MRSPRASAVLIAAAAVLLVAPPRATAQSGSYGSYLDYDGMTRALRTLAGSASGVAALQSMASTADGRDVWLLTIGNPKTGEVDQRPATLVVAGLEGNHFIGGMSALHLADYLVSRFGSDEAVTRLLDRHTFYVLPLLNPDGAQRQRTLSGIEFPYKPDPEDEDRDGRADEDGGDDLNGDGFVTMMRVPDPEGVWIPDPDESRLMRRADRTKGERGVYSLYIEGLDDDGDDRYNEDGPGGTHLNRNWPHQYPYYTDHAGRNQVSEVETRALADFAFTHPNVVIALTYSPYDNLRSAPSSRAQREAPANIPQGLELPPGVTQTQVAEFFRQRTAPTSILPQDAAYFGFISGKFGEQTGLTGGGASGEAGSWPQMAYYQLGFWSFTTPLWTLPQPATDARWLAWFEESGVAGFVDWTPVTHPQLGEVEVGGFIPNVRTNPPADRIADLAARHSSFAVWLAGQAPAVSLEETDIQAKGDGVFLVTATVENSGYLPTDSAMALRARVSHPIVLRLLPARGVTVLSGDPQQQVRTLEGSGGRQTVTWLVSAREGTRLTLEVLARQAGGTITRELTLRQEDLR